MARVHRGRRLGRLRHDHVWADDSRGGLAGRRGALQSAHTFAKEAIRRGIPLGDLQGLLGHTSPATTRIYAPFVVEQQHKVSRKMKSYLADVFKLRRVK